MAFHDFEDGEFLEYWGLPAIFLAAAVVASPYMHEIKVTTQPDAGVCLDFFKGGNLARKVDELRFR
jgi:hypothetical protein